MNHMPKLDEKTSLDYASMEIFPRRYYSNHESTFRVGNEIKLPDINRGQSEPIQSFEENEILPKEKQIHKKNRYWTKLSKIKAKANERSSKKLNEKVEKNDGSEDLETKIKESDQKNIFKQNFIKLR